MSTFLDGLPRDRLLLDVSLWSADLAALGADVARVSPYADLLHLDASDTVFIPHPLFFPDLVRAIRPYTGLPLHVHLMAHRPAPLARAFAEAGADMVTVHAEAAAVEEAIDVIRAAGLAVGVALSLDTQPRDAADFLAVADAVVLIGTPLGTRGTAMSPAALDRITQTRWMLHATGRRVPVFADGGIRPDTVAALAAAGATGVVPGSLLWHASDLASTAAWIRGQRGKRRQP